MKINKSDRCGHCGHWAGDDEVPFVIYSKERAEWLEQAAKQLVEMDQGDDEWFDWVQEGKRLAKLGQ